jgi:CubicO group peptidase (beta-lactamase class C family)
MHISQLKAYVVYGTLGLWQAVMQLGRPGNMDNVLTEETDMFISQVLSDWNSPGGVAVAVVRKDERGIWNVETKGYGKATLSGTKVTENTRFAIGSNSKVRECFT